MNKPLPKSTEDLLRAPLPEADPRPGLETRLLARLDEARPPHSRGLLKPLGLVAAAALVAVAALPLLDRPAPTTEAVPDPAPAPPVERVVVELGGLPNPLREETAALTDRATRTGRFLIDCLPTLPDPENRL